MIHLPDFILNYSEIIFLSRLSEALCFRKSASRVKYIEPRVDGEHIWWDSTVNS